MAEPQQSQRNIPTSRCRGRRSRSAGASIAAGAKEDGRCENGRTYFLEPIERRAIAGLAAQLADPRVIEHCRTTYQAERKRRRTDYDSECQPASSWTSVRMRSRSSRAR
jgi:hypothetical protein